MPTPSSSATPPPNSGMSHADWGFVRPSSIWCGSATRAAPPASTRGSAGEACPHPGGESAEPVRPAGMAGGLHAARRGVRGLDHLPHGTRLREEIRAHRLDPHLSLSAAGGGLGCPWVYAGVCERDRAVLHPVVARPAHARLRRRARLQPAGPVRADRGILQAVGQEIPLRSPRPRARALRGEIRTARLLLPPVAAPRAPDVPRRGRLDRDRG